MRIQQLSLDFFGHFTGKRLEFGPADRGSDFHLIYGPNEAGKTTTMEAYLRLLYGFDHREDYAFQHQRANLRVSALLEIDGAPQPFTRLPTRKGDLRGAADAVLPEAALAAHLGGLSLADYRSLLCLDDATIERGGEEIAKAEGDIGRLLFSAAAGVEDLSAVIEAEREAAAQIYKKRASSTKVAELKRALAEVDASLRETDISASTWSKLRDASQAAAAAEQTARGTRDALHREAARIAALRRALPKLAELDALHQGLAPLADYPARLDLNPETLVQMMTQRTRAETDLSRLTSSLAETEAALAGLDQELDAAKLDLAGQLHGLADLPGRVQSAEQDIPKRQAEQAEILAQMQSIAAGLGAAPGCDVAALVPSPAEIATLEQLRDAMQRAAAAAARGRQDLADHAPKLGAAQIARDALDRAAAPAAQGIAQLLARFDPARLAPAHATAVQAIRSAEEGLREALDALAQGPARFDALPGSCPLDPATAKERAAAHAAQVEQLSRARDRQATLGAEIAALRARAAQISAQAGLVEDSAAAAAQAQRDRLWDAHRAALTAESADAFHPAMQALDRIAAARLAAAAELGALRKLEQDIAEAGARATQAQAQIDQAAAQAQAQEAQAQDLAAQIGLPPLSPAALSDWMQRFAAAQAAQQRLHRARADHQEPLDQAARLVQQLAPLLDLDAPAFEPALAAAQRLAEAERANQDQRRAATEKAALLAQDQDARQQQQAALDDAVAQANQAWQDAVRGRFGDALRPDLLAAAPALLRDLREQDAARRLIDQRLAAMRADQQRFAAAIAALAAPFAGSLALDGPPLKLFDQLRQIAAEATAAQARRAALAEQHQASAAQIAELKTTLDALDQSVAEQGKIFPPQVDTASLDALRRAVGTAQDAIDKRAEARKLAAQILDDLSLASLTEARAALADETAQSLDAQAAALASDQAQAEASLSEATRASAHAERDLAAITGSAESAELVARRATLSLELEAAVLDYLARALGLRLAEAAIARYRDRHRSAMMAATERAFAALTNGAYQRLETRPSGTSEVLLAVGASGTPKEAAAMSKGTRFQLYLALRAAAYEQLVAQGVQLPFFCDDIFETFDEDRTRAACRLMEQIGQRGQAIYLTHHRHVLDLAAQVCDVPPKVHHLRD